MEHKRLTFITSNNVKLAHARHICKEYDVEIIQHKKLFYGIGYNEPRITNRDSLLKESIEDAMHRWKKYVSERQLFFIEDTSVVIEALSSDKEEVPGVDVKYWMQDKTFEELDAELKAKGNNRNVTVYSHVILFLTKDLQEEGELKYKTFIGQSHGSIAEKETEFETNIIYPWLDNKSFNKWFIPNGYDKPISLLEIEDSNKVDFRRSAILQMLNFLCSSKIIHKSELHKTPFQTEFNFKDSYIICGQTCAGKSTAGKYLVDKYGYYHLEASDFMTLKYFETCGTSFTVNKNKFAAKMLETDPTIVVKGLWQYMKYHKINNRFVITGFRNKDEILSFINKWTVEYSHIFYLNADYNIRYQRWINRKRDDVDYDLKKFNEINEIQKEMGVTEIPSIDNNIVIIENNGKDKQMFYNDIDSIVDLNNDLLNDFDLQSYHLINKIRLEEAILVALLSEYADDKYFTTTEIAYLINGFFINIKKKNKNNISRYFNQAYYPYYEIRKEKDTLKYKLSPTGYSEAIHILKKIQHRYD